MSEPIQISDADYEELVLKSDLPVILDFWASWCAPCHSIAPILDRIAIEFDGKLRVMKLDVDSNPLTAQRLGVQGLPTLLFLRSGQEISRLVGSHPETRLRESVGSLIA